MFRALSKELTSTKDNHLLIRQAITSFKNQEILARFWNPWHAMYHRKGSIKMAGALKLRCMPWQQFFSVRFTFFVNLAQLVAGVDSPLTSAAPRVQDAWIRMGVRSTSITQSVEPTTTMLSPSFNPPIGHSIRSDFVLPC